MRSGWYIISKRTGSSRMLLWIIPKCTKDFATPRIKRHGITQINFFAMCKTGSRNSWPKITIILPRKWSNPEYVLLYYEINLMTFVHVFVKYPFSLLTGEKCMLFFNVTFLPWFVAYVKTFIYNLTTLLHACVSSKIFQFWHNNNIYLIF